MCETSSSSVSGKKRYYTVSFLLLQVRGTPETFKFKFRVELKVEFIRKNFGDGKRESFDWWRRSCVRK